MHHYYLFVIIKLCLLLVIYNSHNSIILRMKQIILLHVYDKFVTYICFIKIYK